MLFIVENSDVALQGCGAVCRDKKGQYIEGNKVPDIICDKEKNYDISPAILQPHLVYARGLKIISLSIWDDRVYLDNCNRSKNHNTMHGLYLSLKYYRQFLIVE